ncbi:hypothetical protein V2J09_000989 [Rumex salicifolius]
MNVTRNLSNHLGVPVITEKVTKETFHSLICKLNTTLAGWKTKTLSFAGRVTRAKSVHTSLLVYTMNSMKLKLDSGTFDSSFYLGRVLGRQEDSPCLLAEYLSPLEGGWDGFAEHVGMNLAVLGKSAWKLTTSMTGSEFKGTSFPKQSFLKRRIRSGTTCRFWEDWWVEERPLIEACAIPKDSNVRGLKVCDFWRQGSGWDWGKIHHLVAVSILDDCDQPDCICWDPLSNGVFTTTSVYDLIRPRSQGFHADLGRAFKLVWRTMVPKRIRIFLWLVLKGKMLTNAERKRRHMTGVDTCSRCTKAPETLVHLFRDCDDSRIL